MVGRWREELEGVLLRKVKDSNGNMRVEVVSNDDLSKEALAACFGSDFPSSKKEGKGLENKVGSESMTSTV
jgi:hypothetical protein